MTGELIVHIKDPEIGPGWFQFATGTCGAAFDAWMGDESIVEAIMEAYPWATAVEVARRYVRQG